MSINNKIPSVAVVTSGYLPVPNVRGGAVEALDMMMIRENEKSPSFDFTVFSSWSQRVEASAKGFLHSHFVFMNTPWFVKITDQCIYGLAKYVLHKKKLTRYRYIAQRLWFTRWVGAELSRNNFDAVLVENHAMLFRAMKSHNNSQKYAGKVYYHLHNEVLKDLGSADEIAKIKKVLGVSQYIVNTLDDFLRQKVGKSLHNDQKAVWRNCVDTERFNPNNIAIQQRGAEFRKKLGISEKRLVFLFSGRLTPEKGAEELLQAFLQASIPNSVLVIAGAFFYDSNIASPFEERLHQLAEQAGDRIKFTGFVHYEDMPAIYAMADVCCLPSIWNDPAPLAVIETLSSGRPLITTYSGGIPEYADEQSAILLHRDNDLVNNISKAMKSLASDRDKRLAMGQHGREIGGKLGVTYYLEQLQSLLETKREA